MKQGLLFDSDDAEDGLRRQRSGTFVDNMQLPVHRWYRYSAGFSAAWVAEVIREAASPGRLHVFDPFVGSGTVVLEAERAGVDGMGVEAHPFVARVARAKLLWRHEPKQLRSLGGRIVAAAEKSKEIATGYAALIAKCYPSETLTKLHALKRTWEQLNDDAPASELCWLAFVSILRAASPVGTAQWQYILPKKSKSQTVDPLEAFAARVGILASDMATWQAEVSGPSGKVLCEDARDCPGVPDSWADLVVTSPPYANNYDYADATRLEMTFLGQINGWGDLQSAVRERLIRSCTQHVASFAANTTATLAESDLLPIVEELAPLCQRLEAEKENHGGKKPYHAMVAHYFFDLARVWKTLRRVTRRGGRVCFVVGDSAPYGIHVPVERWLGELALAAGFKSYRFDKLRDRNTKWKNRKHRVPLHEGHLWVEG